MSFLQKTGLNASPSAPVCDMARWPHPKAAGFVCCLLNVMHRRSCLDKVSVPLLPSCGHMELLQPSGREEGLSFSCFRAVLGLLQAFR